MQSAYLKIVLPAILLIITCFNASSQVSNNRLRTADSLYNAKLYTQSLEHYEAILAQNHYSPAMLLKMAYIQEGLNNIGRAMYYLNLYFNYTNDKSVLEKIEELADRHNLEGYDASDLDRFLSLYYDQYNNISIFLTAFITLLLATIFYTRIRKQQRPVTSGVILLLLMIAFFVHINFGAKPRNAILANPTTYIMNGPSAAAPLVTIAGDGHRVQIIGRKDVWVKVRWNGEVAYIRDQALLPVGM